METYFIKMTGRANVPSRVEIGHNYRLTVDASVTQEQRIDNNDGTFDVISKVEPITIEIQKDNGPVVKAKDPRRNSEKIRKWLWKNWSDEGCIEDFEAVYNAFTDEVMAMTPTLMREALKRIR